MYLLINQGKHGWCQTSGDFTNLDDIDMSVDNDVWNSKDWGFCTEECDLAGLEGAETGGILRFEKNVDVLDEDHCQEFLNVSLRRKEVQYRPKILCIGEYLPFRPEFYWTAETDLENAKDWAKAPDIFVEHNKDELRKLNEQPDDDDTFWKDWYLESAGTCNGDSGGPLYLQKYKSGEGNKYVLTGAVSGGRGITGNCGGINNPTHYVR